jgi:hypothetical protein
MTAAARGTIGQAWNGVVAAIEAAIGDGGKDDFTRLLAGDPLVRLAQRGFIGGARL